MPVYDYLCPDCGPFTDMRPMAECDLPQDCPDCGTSAPRVILTAPHFSGLSAERRLVHATNERNAHAPRTAAQFRAEKAEQAARHGRGCSCCSGNGKTMSRFTARGKDGSKSFPTSRPWMISH
jgi:putative FmdB family regulatory protein